MIPFLKVSDTRDVDIIPVDCPTCPVNMSCLAGKSGTGWRFACCGTAVIYLGHDLVMTDCQINQFKDSHRHGIFNVCPLCSGSIMEVVELAHQSGVGLGTSYYLPTVHAKISLAERLTRLRERHQTAKNARTLACAI